MVDDLLAPRLVSWGNAWFRSLTSPDEAVRRIASGPLPHRVASLPVRSGGPTEPPTGAAEVGLSLALGELRSQGATGLRLALPEPGDPLGLAGPPEFNQRALAAGQAVVVVGEPDLGLLPEVSRAQVTWHCLPARDGAVLAPIGLAEAQRELRAGLEAAVEELARMDVAGASGAAREALRGLDAAGGERLAPGFPPRAVRVLLLAERVTALLRIAETDDGAAVSAASMAARAKVLRDLAGTARRALVAAHDATAAGHPAQTG